MSAPRREAPGPTATSVAGIARVALGVVLLAILALGTPEAGPLAFVSAGLAIFFGGLLAAGRPLALAREPLAVVALDSLLAGLLVAGTGGAGSPFFPVYLLAALGVFWIPGPVKAAVATAVIAGAYLLAVGFAGGPGEIWTLPAGLGLGFVALFCAAAAYLGSGARDLAGRERGLSSALAAERDRAARSEGLVGWFGSVLENSSLEEILAWTARTAHAGCGGSYAHVAILEGNHHASIFEGDGDACPSWWHPSIQGLALRACREGAAVHSEEEVHGIGGFLAVPVGLAAGDGRGAVIVGGGEFGAEEERVLALISGAAGPALESVEDAPGGRDPVSGLPNRASLHRVLRRELARGRALTVFAVEVAGLARRNRTRGFAAGDDLLRRVGGRLGRNRRAFRYGGDELVVVLGGTDEARARRAALAIRQAISDEAGETAPPAVGFVHAGPGHEDADLVLKSALLALREAKAEVEGVVGFPDPTEVPGAGGRSAEIVETLIGALEAKDPGIGEHLREVSRISRGIAGGLSLTEEQLEDLVTGALLHDVGKIGVPDRILQKPGRLTEEEYRLITRHPALGAEIVSPVGKMAPVLSVVRHHHERFDGKGYPDGLRGEEIPLLARIVSVADAFDSMVRERPYGYSISREAALEEIQSNSGTQFDPGVVEALIRVERNHSDRRASSAN
jgi:diguanylate cyclase (GGDEF)-like protein